MLSYSFSYRGFGYASSRAKPPYVFGYTSLFGYEFIMGLRPINKNYTTEQHVMFV